MSDDEARVAAEEIFARALRGERSPGVPTVTRFHDPTPPPPIGSAPPVAQKGAPPMSQRATDISRVMLYGGLATVPPGLIAIGILVASRHADPTVVGMICAAPAALAVPILALARLFTRAKEVVEAAPPVEHHHYGGAVVYQDHTTVTTNQRGLITTSRNELPE
ncbi:hypothetical protein Sipo7851_21225 [Streptomyces ipomoeae]|nr:hypothetical protein Sipo7851_21225 [Streptomyces ipomoeae]